tara:strand:+ start:11496 stop:12923 length:1428 start_codon:yes stop_codon:yes gene_type:complete
VSNLEKEIQSILSEAEEPKAKGSEKPDPDAEKKAADAADKAGDAVKQAKAPGGEGPKDKGDEVKDGATKKDDKKAVNMESEDHDEDESLDEMSKDEMMKKDEMMSKEMSKAEMMKKVVNAMKLMDMKHMEKLMAMYKMSEDEDDADEKSESLSRNAMIKSMVETLSKLSKEEIMKAFKEMKDMDKDEEDEEVKSEAKSEMKMKDDEDDKDEDVDEDEEEDEDEMDESVDMSDDIDALVADEDLTEEFKNKAKTIFEAAVSSKVKSSIDEIEAKYEESTREAIEEIKEDLTKKVDEYLGYVAESWVSENELAIERGLKSELTEGFINGLKNLFEEHYVEVPEEKFDVIEELASRNDKLDSDLSEEVANNITLSQEIEELKREKIIREASEGLADSEVEKLKTLAEDVDYENEENFVEKVSTIKESYFKSDKAEAVSDAESVANNEASFEEPTETILEGDMGRYSAAISKSQTVDIK